MEDAFRYRWVAVCVFVLSSTLNYLDRQLLAFFAPAIAKHFSVSMTQIGLLITCFSIAYAASALFTGAFLDRAGVNRGVRAAVACWSAASIASAFAPGFRVLAACRAALGIGESAGVPAVGKLNGLYLKPEERALGAAVNQIGLTLGAMLSPLWVMLPSGTDWRLPFLVSGLLGFAWIPVWSLVSRRIKPHFSEHEIAPSIGSEFSLLRDRDLQLLVLANVLWMGTYSLWTNWTTVYFVQWQHISLREAASYVWIPPLISNIGGFFGGWLSLRWIKRGASAVAGRRRAIWISAAGSLVTLLLPLTREPVGATVIMSLSFFFVLGGSVNIYALPIDLYGPANAAFGIAALTCSYGILQAFISPIVGYLADHRLFSEMVWLCTLPLLLAAFVVHAISSDPPKNSNLESMQNNGSSFRRSD